MLEHIVLLRLKPDASQQQVQTMGAKLREMADRVPGVVEVVAGRNVSTEGRHQGYDYVLLVRLKDQAARDAYLENEFHRKVAAEYVLPVIDGIIVADVLGSA